MTFTGWIYFLSFGSFVKGNVFVCIVQKLIFFGFDFVLRLKVIFQSYCTLLEKIKVTLALYFDLSRVVYISITLSNEIVSNRS